MAAEVRGFKTRLPFSVSPLSGLRMVALCSMPPLTTVATAWVICTGLTAMPWP